MSGSERKMKGVSIVICCHNSAKRLPPTLAHLASQRDCDGIPWEVIVVDNASQDETAQVALELWPKDAPAPLRVVHEPRLGLSYARQRGLTEAQYEIVSFIDDDNWVTPNWVRTVLDVMSEHPEVAACGGCNENVCEVDPPWWFEQFKSQLAIGAQGQQAGDVTETRGWLWGAGLTIRKSAWLQLINNGFHQLLVGRQSDRLTSGEDVELCFALRLAGWRLWYEPRLVLYHFIPANRLRWTYFRRLNRGFGAQTVWLDAYHFALRGRPTTLKETLERTWQWQVFKGLLSLRLYRKTLLKVLKGETLEGNYNLLYLERLLGRLSELLRLRGVYGKVIQKVANASWISIHNSDLRGEN